ncbi:LytR/AlgR family response regulator transcription factor [Teredinibacter turnerae]|uniref:LytR/AlgR family response regulator transcription factor n=1 Tax=Teredinibacter turnerae TaxID=2426 RepID=UPI000412AA9C|nr:LytTR family DNA-binding domain-containing protein [Teredinibacter turnerae]
MTLSAVIVDDEPHARQALERMLGEYPQIAVVDRCENGLAAVKAVHKLQPDVLFLDIQMPKLDGFDVLELLGEAAPLVVFVTAHDDYAIRAFENNAVDYLLKPVAKARLQACVDRLHTRLQTSSPQADTMENLLTVHQQENTPINRILVREKGDVHVVMTRDIIALEAADDYVVIHTAQQKLIKQERLSKLETRLDPRQFCRIHRSAIINLDYLAGIETETKDSRLANLKNGMQLAISRAGYSKLVQLL